MEKALGSSMATGLGHGSDPVPQLEMLIALEMLDTLELT